MMSHGIFPLIMGILDIAHVLRVSKIRGGGVTLREVEGSDQLTYPAPTARTLVTLGD